MGVSRHAALPNTAPPLPAAKSAAQFVGPRLAPAGVVAAVALLSVVIGLAVGIQFYAVGVGMVALLGAALIYSWYLLLSPSGPRTDIPFWALLAVGLLLIPLSQAVLGVKLNFTAELVLFAAAPVAIVATWQRLRWTAGERIFVVMFFAYLVWQVLVSMFGRSSLIGAGYQFATNLKPFLLLLLGFTLAWRPATESVFWFVVRWAWLYLGALVALQIIAPGTFLAHFGGNLQVDRTPNPLMPFLTRMQGPFGHSSVLATFSIQFVLFAACRAWVLRSWRYVLVMVPYLLLAALSGQRQEIFVLVVVALVLWVSIRYRMGLFRMAWLATLGCAVAVAVLWPLLGDNLQNEVSLWRSSGAVGAEGVRSALYDAAAAIANDFAPLGSGLGTFGGPGAVRFDQSLYVEMGIGRFWWFQRGLFLMDSIWACYIAELGWLGAAWLLALFAALVATAAAVHRAAASKEDRLYALMAMSALIYALLVSPTAFVITDPVTGLLSFALLGLAYGRVYDVGSRAAP